MEIREIADLNNQDTWNKFVAENSSPSSFLQTSDWGMFKRDCLGEEIRAYIIYNDNTLINADENADQHRILATVLLVKKKLPFGRFYWECPRGPIIKCQMSNAKCQNDVLKLVINEIIKTAKMEKVVFVRLELPYFCHPHTSGDLEKKEWILGSIGNDQIREPSILNHSVNPKNTLILDLTKSETEILAAMHPKWRYNIRLAERKLVKVSNQQLTVNNKKTVEVFYDLLRETAERDGIKIFSKKYYEQLMGYFYDLRFTIYDLRITLFFSEYQGQILSAIMVIGFGDTVTYLHGGSSNINREVMPNHAVQWAAMKWAKSQGYHWYDFWGVARQQTTDNKRLATDSWAGITRFKKGFVSEQTGKTIDYVGARDYVLDKKWYNLFRVGKVFKI